MKYQGRKDRYSSARHSLEAKLNTMRNTWLSNKADDIQCAADQNNSKQFYFELKSFYGPQSSGSSPIHSVRVGWGSEKYYPGTTSTPPKLLDLRYYPYPIRYYFYHISTQPELGSRSMVPPLPHPNSGPDPGYYPHPTRVDAGTCQTTDPGSMMQIPNDYPTRVIQKIVGN